MDDICLQKKYLVQNSTAGKIYYRVENRDGKIWYFCKDGIREGLKLYQPSSFKGHLIKILLKNRITVFALSILGFVQIDSIAFNDELMRYINKVFHNDNLSFSIFCGTPGRHQKGTVQICSSGHILGYLKITDNLDIYKAFNKESRLLNKWKSITAYHIPRPLAMDELENIYIYFQSTEKKVNSKESSRFDSLLFDRVRKFNRETKYSGPANKTEFYNNMLYYKVNIECIPKKNQELMLVYINQILTATENNELTFCGCHGDFTPWNSFYNSEEMFVFDFEYAKESYPEYYDLFHYFFQKEFYGKNNNENIIVKKYKECDIFRNCNNELILLKCYLVDIIFFYSLRDGFESWDETNLNCKRWKVLYKLSEEIAI